MSERRQTPDADDQADRREGPNLVLAYSLIALGLLVAIAFAALIVWPFYKAR